jgi:Fe-S cluster biogenesis protein NfuA
MMVNAELIKRVEEALENIRPYLQTDGGDVEVIDITPEMVVRLRLVGSCESCSMSAMTMKAGIEKTIRKAIPEILGVEAVSETQITQA